MILLLVSLIIAVVAALLLRVQNGSRLRQEGGIGEEPRVRRGHSICLACLIGAPLAALLPVSQAVSRRLGAAPAGLLTGEEPGFLDIFRLMIPDVDLLPLDFGPARLSVDASAALFLLPLLVLAALAALYAGAGPRFSAQEGGKGSADVSGVSCDLSPFFPLFYSAVLLFFAAGNGLTMAAGGLVALVLFLLLIRPVEAPFAAAGQGRELPPAAAAFAVPALVLGLIRVFLVEASALEFGGALSGACIAAFAACAVCIGVWQGSRAPVLSLCLHWCSLGAVGLCGLFLGAGLVLGGQGQGEAALYTITGAALLALNLALVLGLLYFCCAALEQAGYPADGDRLGGWSEACKVPKAMRGDGSGPCGGLMRAMPVTAVCFGLGTLSLSLVPPLNGFCGVFAALVALAEGGAAAAAEGAFLAMLLAWGVLLVAASAPVLCLPGLVRRYAAIFLGPPRGVPAGIRLDPPAARHWILAALALACLAAVAFAPDIVGIVAAALALPAVGAGGASAAFAAGGSPGSFIPLDNRAAAFTGELAHLPASFAMLGQALLVLAMLALLFFLLRRRMLRDRELESD